MFKDKTYWIVGASDGLGKAIAQELDREGAKLILSARREEALKDLVKGLHNATALPVDVTDATSVENAFKGLEHVDCLIYCAGAYQPMTAMDWKPDAAELMIDVNLTGAARLLSRLVPQFVKRNSGHIVLIGSLSGFRALPGAIGYSASKAGLMHLAENLYADLRDTDVTVQQINPGFIATRLTDQNDFKMPQIMSADKAAQRVIRAIRSGRFSTSFPYPFALLFTLGRFLPRKLFYSIFR